MQVQLLDSFQAIELVGSCELVHLGEDERANLRASTDLLWTRAYLALFLLFNPTLDHGEVRDDDSH